MEMSITRVEITKKARKEIRNLPVHIVVKLLEWVQAVDHFSLENVRRISGFHDEPLKGKRFGQRSIRLSRGYRAIYIIKKDHSIEFISVEEVHKHKY
jgi:proteic killer suppression protein